MYAKVTDKDEVVYQLSTVDSTASLAHNKEAEGPQTSRAVN